MEFPGHQCQLGLTGWAGNPLRVTVESKKEFEAATHLHCELRKWQTGLLGEPREVPAPVWQSVTLHRRAVTWTLPVQEDGCQEAGEDPPQSYQGSEKPRAHKLWKEVVWPGEREAKQGCKATYKYLKISPRHDRTKLVTVVTQFTTVGGKARGNSTTLRFGRSGLGIREKILTKTVMLC